MSDQRDELLLGPEVGRARDSDGDGVSDVQEGLDGTDPNDPTSMVRHDKPVLGPDVDPRGNPELVNLDENVIVDVTSSLPAGMSVEQNLPVGLDGGAITTQRHYGNADADKMFGERVDTNSPLEMERDPLDDSQVAAPSTPQYGTATGSFTEAGKTGDSSSFTGSSYSTPPPGAELGSRAPDMGLVSADRVIPQAKDRTADQRGQDPSQAKPAEAPDFFDGSWTKEVQAGIQEVQETIKEAANSVTSFFTIGTGKMTDPDAAGGTVVPTEEQLARAVVVHDGTTDFVEGYGGGPQIEGDAPPRQKIDLVTDGGDDDATEGAVTKVTIPGLEISKPVNVHDDIVGGPALLPQGGNIGGVEASPDQPGLMSESFAATASEASNSQPGTGTGVVNIGDGAQTGGIASVDVEFDEGGAVQAPLDPVADAMRVDAASFETSPELFAVDGSQVDPAIPDEPNLDDGF